MTLTPLDYLFIALAAVAGGAVNAIAGGGTLITFPALTGIGLSSVSANITNTIALSPGYLSGTMAQAKDMEGQWRRLRLLAPTGFIGGLVGALLLIYSGERVFRILVPFLILLASALLAFQDRIRRWIVARLAQSDQPSHEGFVIGPIFLASIYGGYFGAGLSVILLAVLGLVIHDSLTRLNALKQAVSFCVNIAAALFFLFSGQVVWSAAAVMAVGALAGGVLGGRLASRIKAQTLRRVVVTFGVIIGLYYLVQLFR